MLQCFREGICASLIRLRFTVLDRRVCFFPFTQHPQICVAIVCSNESLVVLVSRVLFCCFIFTLPGTLQGVVGWCRGDVSLAFVLFPFQVSGDTTIT